MLAADLQELLKALEKVGIVSGLADPSLLEQLRELFLDVTGPLTLVLELVDEALERLFNLEGAGVTGENTARAASLDLELLAGDIDRMIASIQPGDIHQSERDALVRSRPRLEQIINQLDGAARALGEVTGEAATITARIEAAKQVLSENQAEIARELDRAALPEEDRTTPII